MDMHKNIEINNKGLKILLWSLLILLVIVICCAPLLGKFFSSGPQILPTTSEVASTKLDYSNQQAECLDKAFKTYDEKWKAADKDGDSKVSYTDGASSITITYYDNVISCYRIWKTDNSDGIIEDYRQKRQQESDRYNAWLSRPTYAPSTGTHCTSTSYGSSTYTNCY